MQLTFFSDPGHGWLRVPRATVEKLGILNQISPYSYQRGDQLYLEEDCDARLFMKTSGEAGMAVYVKMAPPANNSSKIRSYDSFKAA